MSEATWNLLKESGTIMLVIAGLAFVVAEITKNYSQTDKLWGLAPIIYVWHLAWRSGFDERLSYNFSRRGGFSWKFWTGEEDYRWAVLQNMSFFKGKPFRWTLFNLFFIAFYQHTLIWLICMPALVAIEGNAVALHGLDYLSAALIIGFLVLETMADQQQFDFQTEKYRKINAGEALEGEYQQGFISTGLWRIARHPNYAAEQAIWVVFYFFSVAATDRWINWSLVGALLLLLLFRGSSDFSERISSGKYPRYKDYQKRVGRFLPSLRPGNKKAAKAG